MSQPTHPLPHARKSIFGEFMLLSTLIMLPFLIAIGWYIFSHFNHIMEEQHLSSLESLAEEKVSTINRYIEDHLKQVETLSLLPLTRQSLRAVTAQFHDNGPESAAYRQTSRKHGAFFESFLSHWRYYDLFLIDPQGNIVYSIKHESDFGTNLRTGLYRDSGLGQVFRDSITTLQSMNSGLSFYAPSNEASAFIAAPIIDENEIIGVVALQFNTDEFYAAINSYAGLGESGEVVVGQMTGRRIIITAPLRHDPDAAFKRTIGLDAKNALPLRMSAAGHSGSGILIDWRGEEVLAVWQYIPALKWGMVVKIDTAEAFGHWRGTWNSLIGLIGLGLLFSYLLLYFFSRRITKPLCTLTAASMELAAGKQDIHIESLLEISNETGLLANAFNDMSNQIHSAKAALQHKVEELAEHNRLLDLRVAEQTEHVRAAIEYAADGIITMNEQGEIINVNPAISHIFGYRQEDLVGQCVTMLMPEQYRDRHLRALQRHCKAESSPPVDLSTELEGLRKSGEIFPIDLRINEMLVAGQKLFLGTIRDITGRKKLEAEQRRLAMAVEQTKDAVLITDPDGLIEYVNPAYEALSGYAAVEVIGKTPAMVKSGKMPLSFYQQMWRTLLSGQSWRAEFINKNKSGELYDVDQAISPIFDAENNIIAFVSLQRDITAEKQEREKLEHTQRLESLGVLAGGIAHDFNNLLTAILGNAALARNRIDKASPAAEMLENIEKASERAAALCKQMLAYSGKGKFVVEALDLTAIIEEMMNLLQVSINKNVVLRLDLSEQLLAIEGDAAQMQQVIMNLVINASEAIDKRSGIITIHTGVVEIDDDYIQTTYINDGLTPGRFVALEVSDTGCGMDEDVKKRLFDPFFTTKFTGRGLGMSAILGIVRGHHGAIKVYSEVGRGTTFKVIFPCAGTIEAVQSQAVNSEQEPRAHGVILIVDDEETIRVTAALMLEEAGFETLTAVDGQDGVDMFRQHQSIISAVLLDMTMPRMNGDEAFREIRAIDPEVKVILSSGYNEQDATSHFAGKGLAGFIQKPYSPTALQEKVKAILS